MNFDLKNLFPYRFPSTYSKSIAYFSMEFAIDQSLKTYSGGLGFLAGSHMRSAFELKQNLIGIGIYWKYGYYDQERNRDGSLKVNYVQKDYYFLEDTGIKFTIDIHRHPVHVKVLLLRPEIFNSAPIFYLSTDVPENDFLAQTICHRLYDNHESARIAQSILLGVGGARLLDLLGRETEVYHMNEGHALPLCFYLLQKFNGDLSAVQQRVVFTTHTPEPAGNEEHAISTLEVMGFFQGADHETIKSLAADTTTFNYTLAALRMARVANGVSQLHGEVSREMWKSYPGICPIKAITNAQNQKFWMDEQLEKSWKKADEERMLSRKKEMKRELFKVVADQTGRLFSEDIITIVWARRFAAYKRADLILQDLELFRELVSDKKHPVQIIWAGKPYPEDATSIEGFNRIFYVTKEFANCAVLTGYEIGLSGLLKKGSDVWLNNPKMYREASGTSGMTAAMNGSINLSIPDGWIPEFAEHGKNCFLITPAPDALSQEEKDSIECANLYRSLREEVLPIYYTKQKTWAKLMWRGISDVLPQFDANRMAAEYYQELYRVN
ncbi:MAG: alpha-glucan family phosphorylase [Bacteroidota bacterium]|jgi:starch phosphorylase